MVWAFYCDSLVGGFPVDVFVDLDVALFAGAFVDSGDCGSCFDQAPFFADFCLDSVDVESDVYFVGNGFLEGVFADEVLYEECECLFCWGCCESDYLGVEVFEDLSPLTVDAAVAFVDDDEVEGFGWESFRVDRFYFTVDGGVVNICGEGFGQWFSFESCPYALDG